MENNREESNRMIRKLLPCRPDEREEPVVFGVIRATGDTEYADLLLFENDPLRAVKTALLHGAHIVTDAPAAYSAIDIERLEKLGGKCLYFNEDEDVKNEAVRRGLTPAAIAMRKAAKMHEPFVCVIAESPEALHEIGRIERTGHLDAAAVVAVPAGFVQAEEAKEEILRSGIPVIVSRGTKGGSQVGAAIINAILEEL